MASAAGEFCKDANCVITHSGRVSCIPPCSHTAKCTPNYDRWPFDRQNCTLHIGTWVNSGEEIDFKVLKTIITEDELSSQNMEWRLTQATYKRNSGNFSESKQTYPSLTFSFVIDRHSATNGACILATALGKRTHSHQPAFAIEKKLMKSNLLFSFSFAECRIIMGGFNK